jgi:DMSO reductase anchor subunit
VEEREAQSLEKETQSVESEARMVLPGIQAIFGFQLIAIFNESFARLEPFERVLHLTSLALVAVSTALIMAPAAYHRIAERGQVSKRFVDLASSLLAWAMAVLAAGIAVDFYIATRLAVDSRAAGILLALGVLILFGWLWFVFPLRQRQSPRRAQDH